MLQTVFASAGIFVHPRVLLPVAIHIYSFPSNTHDVLLIVFLFAVLSLVRTEIFLSGIVARESMGECPDVLYSSVLHFEQFWISWVTGVHDANFLE